MYIYCLNYESSSVSASNFYDALFLSDELLKYEINARSQRKFKRIMVPGTKIKINRNLKKISSFSTLEILKYFEYPGGMGGFTCIKKDQ